MRNRTKSNSALCLIALTAFASLAVSHAHGNEVEKRTVLSVDFAFDGGSLRFELNDHKANTEYLHFINPESPIRTKYPHMTCCWSGDNGLEEEIRLGLTNENASNLIASIAGNNQIDNNVRDSCLALLLAYVAKMPIQTWGHEAVEAIEKGRWNLLLIESQSDNEEAADPFNF